jgi:hypothetical protein
VKFFVARFWTDFKESEAVCANYFCAEFRFGNEWDHGVTEFGVVRTGAQPAIF